MKRIWIPTILLILLILANTSVFAQSYYFELNRLFTDVFINSDGSVSLTYQFVFTNTPSASPIEYVDIGMPSGSFSLVGATADVDGNPVSLSRSDYEGSGSGFAVVLGSAAIRPGKSGSVNVTIPNAGTWLRYDDDKTYASFAFSPTWFGSQYVTGSTQIRVSFHLPPGVQTEEPRWHAAPSGWSPEPQTSLDSEGRVVYTWENQQASGSSQYTFGASFPSEYVPSSAISQPTFFERLGVSADTCFTFLCCGGIFSSIIGIGWWSTEASKRRKLQYLPPKVAIEGLGVKRGLTAVEAATLMEQPLDKVMTMILFGVIKKAAAAVKTRDPLELTLASPLPEGLNSYELDFLKAFEKTDKAERRKALQTMMIALVTSVSTKMKGFSRKETIAYYKNITEKAWGQVEAAQTPQVKSEAYEKNIEWTMLDKEYDDRTREVFRTGPVFIPTWWGRYDPTFSRPAGSGSSIPSQTGLPSGGQISLPTLPGGSFAASIVTGVQGFSAGVIGNITDFTGAITNKTNPMPVASPSRSSGGGRSGGGGCACACACAGCACACAGGGR